MRDNSAAPAAAVDKNRRVYSLRGTGGRVIDAVRDVAVAAGRIAAVAESVAADATETIDARSKIVTPGLVDFIATPPAPKTVLHSACWMG